MHTFIPAHSMQLQLLQRTAVTHAALHITSSKRRTLTSSMAHCHMPSRKNARAGKDAAVHSLVPVPMAPPTAAAAVAAAAVGLPSISRPTGAPAMLPTVLSRACAGAVVYNGASYLGTGDMLSTGLSRGRGEAAV